MDLGLPEQHKMSGLEHEDSCNGWACNMPTCQWRKVDERTRGERECCLLTIQARAVAGEGAQLVRGVVERSSQRTAAVEKAAGAGRMADGDDAGTYGQR